MRPGASIRAVKPFGAAISLGIAQRQMVTRPFDVNEPVTLCVNDEVDWEVDYAVASLMILFSAPVSTGRDVRRGIILSLTPCLRSLVDIADTVLRDSPVAATTSATLLALVQFFTKASYEYGALPVLFPLFFDIRRFWHGLQPPSRA
jgi:hypothetical protein